MHNLLGSLQIWEQRRFTQKSCVQLSKYSTVYLASLQYNFMLYVLVDLIRNAELLILLKIKYEHTSAPTWSFSLIFIVLPDYLHLKPYILHASLNYLFLKSFPIYNSV
jgi:hypothetical protein